MGEVERLHDILRLAEARGEGTALCGECGHSLDSERRLQQIAELARELLTHATCDKDTK